MWIKPAIVTLFVLLVIALLSGGFFLFKDQGAKDKKRILWSLGIRVSLAAMLLGVVAYGAFTGQLRSHAPWSKAPQHTQPAIAPEPQPAAPDNRP